MDGNLGAYACQTGSTYVEKSYICVEFPYLCPNYNIYVQIAIYTVYPNCMVIYMSKMSIDIHMLCHFQTVRCIYITQFFDIYIFSCKYYM